jgi:transcriptional regulator with XRE-family HTH domain
MQWVADQVGISNQRLGTYELEEKEPPVELRMQLAKVLQVTEAYLLGLEDLQAARAKAAGLKSVQRARLTQVPVIGTALGGRGESEDWEDHVYIPSHFISGDDGSYKIGAMHLDGESMMPYLRPGDTLVFELSDKPRPGRVSAIQASPTHVTRTCPA